MAQPEDPILVSDDTLRKLSEYVAEQKRANDIKEKEVSAMWRREANNQQVLHRYADLGERVNGLIVSNGEVTAAIRELILAIHGQNEREAEKANQLSRVEDQNLIILGILAGKKGGDPVDFTRLIGQSSNKLKRLAELKELIENHQRRLAELKKKQAKLGQGSPVELETEIEDIETEIAELQSQLLLEL